MHRMPLRRLLSSTATITRLGTRSFHDCPVNELQPLRLLLLGSPGSGKGTQSERLQNAFGVAHLSSGDILRRNMHQRTAVGQRAADYVSNGKLVPDDIMLQLIDAELARVNNPNWLLDGFPRTVPQADALDKVLYKSTQPLNLVVNLEVPEDVILGRIMDRWVHVASGRVYNLSYNPPRVAGVDDITGERLSKRADDNPDVFRVRMKQYKEMTAPLLDHYSQIAVTVRGNTSDEIYPQIEREIVNRLGLLPGQLSVPCTTTAAAAAVSRHRRDRHPDNAADNGTTSAAMMI